MTNPSSQYRRAAALVPLTRTNGLTGQPFRRNPDVERQIAEALALQPSALAERATVRERNDPRFLQEECLVYLIRELNCDAKLRRVASDLAGELLVRIEGYLSSKLRTLGPRHFEEAADEVVAGLFERIADRTSDLADFAQVSFWTFLAAKVSDAYRRHLGLLRKERSEVAPAWVYGSEPSGDEQHLNGSEREPEPAADARLDARMLSEEMLGALPEHYYVMMKLHLAGWPIESKSRGEQTISGYFGKTPRTINNWLRDAQRQLATLWKKDEYELS